MKLSIVLATYNRFNFLRKCIQSLRNELQNIENEIIIIDGGSTDGTLDWLIKQKDITTIIQHNSGIINKKIIEKKSWGYFMNIAFKACHNEYIMMLSDDCLIIPKSIENAIVELNEYIKIGSKIGGLAFYWRNWPEMNQYWVGKTFNKYFINHGIYLKSVLELVEYIDEKNYYFYHADSDLSLKIWVAGYEIIPTTNSYIEHFTHANKSLRNANSKKQDLDWSYYNKKWKEVFTEPNQEEWVFKNYIDIFDTFKLFPFLETKKVILLMKLKSIKPLMALYYQFKSCIFR